MNDFIQQFLGDDYNELVVGIKRTMTGNDYSDTGMNIMEPFAQGYNKILRAMMNVLFIDHGKAFKGLDAFEVTIINPPGTTSIKYPRIMYGFLNSNQENGGCLSTISCQCEVPDLTKHHELAEWIDRMLFLSIDDVSEQDLLIYNILNVFGKALFGLATISTVDDFKYIAKRTEKMEKKVGIDGTVGIDISMDPMDEYGKRFAAENFRYYKYELIGTVEELED